jgi:hypothetical protein
MTDIRQINFDTEELLNNVNIIIQSGLNNLVKDFVEKHKIYEETHKGVLNLPSVKKLLAFNKETNIISDSDSENNDEAPTVFVSIKEMTEDLVDEKIKVLEQTMANSFQVFASRNMIISQKMLSNIETLTSELKELKQAIQDIKPPVIDLTHDSEELEVLKEIKQIVNEVVIKEEPIEEKENIVLQIVEEEEVSEEESDSDSDSDSDDEVEEEKDSGDELEEEVVEVVEEADDELEVEEEKESDDELEVEEVVESEPEDELEEELEDEEEVAESELKEEVQVTRNQDIETEAEESESDEEENEEKEKQEDDDDNELFEIEIEDVTYCTNDEENGIIYELTEEGEAGKKVGFLKDGEATFY